MKWNFLISKSSTNNSNKTKIKSFLLLQNTEPRCSKEGSDDYENLICAEPLRGESPDIHGRRDLRYHDQDICFSLRDIELNNWRVFSNFFSSTIFPPITNHKSSHPGFRIVGRVNCSKHGLGFHEAPFREPVGVLREIQESNAGRS